MDYLTIVNSVLRRLREDEVLTVAESPYSTLIGDFVLATKREMESAWNWNSLRTTIAVTTVDGTSAYSIEGAGKRYTIQDVWDSTNERFLTRMLSTFGRRDVLLADKGQPTRYFIEGIDSSGDPRVGFVLKPDAAYVINFNLIVPQTDSPADDDEILMDEWPIILGGWSKAIEERGEDSGKVSERATEQYKFAASDAIALDVARTQGEDEWHV